MPVYLFIYIYHMIYYTSSEAEGGAPATLRAVTVTRVHTNAEKQYLFLNTGSKMPAGRTP